jgi:hypothetical protein
MNTNWYIARNKQKVGPFSTNQLRQLALLGLVKSTEYVLPEGARRWVPVTTVEGFCSRPAGPQRYWLSHAGRTQGPYVAEQIQVGLSSRRLPPETLVCLEGSKHWTRFADLPEFRAFVPPPSRDSHAHLGLGSSCYDIPLEEAELHLAGKKGDSLARLISTLLDMRRRHANNASMADIIDKNVQALKTIRERGLSGLPSIPSGNPRASEAPTSTPGR